MPTSTLRSVRNTFATVFRSAAERGYLEKNPAHGVVIREGDSKKERRFYSADQVRMLLNVLTEPCASVVAVLTGMRIGEILALRWKRIDLLGATLEVAENYSSGEFGSPKTKSSQRVLPISSALRRVLENQHARMNPRSPEELVFQTPKGTPLSDKNLYNRELAPACDLSLANCYFTHDSSVFPVLLRFRDAQSSRCSHPPLYIDGCRTGGRRNRAIVGPNGPKNAVDDVKAMTVNA